MTNRINTKIKSFLGSNILPLIVLAFAIRVLVSPFGTLDLDFNTFVAWSRNLTQHGFASFYGGWSDYLPGYLYILCLLGVIKGYFSAIPLTLLYKLPAILSDLATGYLIYRIIRDLKNEKLALLGSFLYLFNPAIIANSSLWGQVDSFVALCSMLAVYLVRSKYALSAIFLAIGTLIKPHTAFVAPLIGVIMLKEKWAISKITYYISLAATVFVIAFVPFMQGGDIFGFIAGRLAISLGQYQYTSINAFNFWSLWGMWKPDTVVYQLAGYAFVVLVFALFCLKFWKRIGWEYMTMSVIFLSTYLFTTRMHERHLLAVFAPLSIVSVLNAPVILVLAALTLTYLANLRYSYIWITESFRTIFSVGFIKVISAFNISSFFLMIILMFQKSKISLSNLVNNIKIPMFPDSGAEKFPKANISRKTIKYLLMLVLLFTFFTRVYALSSPKNEYFDEVYHAFTARRMLHGDPKAWEWWNTPPDGFAYEWTHPPLAKYGMVLGMAVFGENSFGWRFPGAVLGVVCVYLLYLVVRELFKDELMALLSAFIFSLDGIFLVISRIGMNDVYFLTFALLSIYLFLRNKYLYSAIILGVSLSAKWSALWVYPVLVLGQILLKRKKAKSFLLYFLIPPLVYLVIYIPFFMSGHSFEQFINIDALLNCIGVTSCQYPFGLQQQMFWYHTHLNATHAYSSPWWSWPLNVRPVYLYTSAAVNNMVSRIYLIDNPMLSWIGVAGVFVLMASFVRKHLLSHINTRVLFVLGAYFVFFIPWALSPRIMFLYHYLPSLPFLAIALAYILRKMPRLMLVALPLMIVTYIYFYPHWAGLSVPEWLDKSYYWFKSWR